jgi:hypothetical protein
MGARVGRNEFVVESKMSAEDSDVWVVPSLYQPPAKSTFPSGSNVAVWPVRAAGEPTGEKKPVDGL